MRKTLIALVTLVMSTAVAPVLAAGEVNLYSYRQPFLIEPMLEEFTKQTGTKVNVVFANKGMVEKIKAAGENNPADAVLTVDVGRLDALQQAGLLESVSSTILDDAIPAHLRHPDGLWFGLTTRARLALTSKERIKPGGDRDACRSCGSQASGTNLHPFRQARVQRGAHRFDESPTRARPRPSSGSPGFGTTSPASPRATTVPRRRGSTKGCATLRSRTTTTWARWRRTTRNRSRRSGRRR